MEESTISRLSPALLLCLLTTAARAEVFTAHVVQVLDADTVDVPDDEDEVHRVRLAGIDAPESGQFFVARSSVPDEC